MKYIKKKHKYAEGGQTGITSQFADNFAVAKEIGMSDDEAFNAAGSASGMFSNGDSGGSSSSFGGNWAGVASGLSGAVQNSFGDALGVKNNTSILPYENKDDDAATYIGAILGVGDLSAMANHVLQADVQNKMNSAKSTLKNVENTILSKNNTFNSYEDILNASSTGFGLKRYSAKDFNPNSGATWANIGKSTLTGMQSGSIGGPWGMAGGAATGLLSGFISAGVGGGRKGKQTRAIANAFNDKIGYLEDLQKSKLTSGAISLNDRINRTQQAKMAYGGSLGISLIPTSGAIDYEMNNRLIDSYNNTQPNMDRRLKAQSFPMYAFGGDLSTNGATWDTGLTYIGNGGSHETNPLEGVPMGVAQDGEPNLVEEGEVIWNDYVFSNRLNVPKAIRHKYKLRGKKELTFADAAKQIQKEKEERPNDPITQKGTDDMLNMLAGTQEEVRAEKQKQDQFNQSEDMAAFAADGGPIHIAKNKRGTFTAAATKHGMGVQEFARQVLAHKEKYSPEMVKKANFAHNSAGWSHALGGYLFAGGGKKPITEFKYWDTNANDYQKDYLDWVNGLDFDDKDNELFNTMKDYYKGSKQFTSDLAKKMLTDKDYGMMHTIGGNAYTKYLLNNSEQLPQKIPTDQYFTWFKSPETTEFIKLFPTGENTPQINDDDDDDDTNKKFDESFLRYSPIIGSGIGEMISLADSPNYQYADAIDSAARFGAQSIPSVTRTPLGNYLGYQPFDTLFYANQLGQQANATRNNIRNVAGTNPGAVMIGMLAADYNAQNSLGDLYRKAEEYNQAERAKVAEFNRATDQYNSQSGLTASKENADIAKAKADLLYNAAVRSNIMRTQEDALLQANRSQSMTNFFDNLGDLGREAAIRNMVNTNPAWYYDIDENGNISYRNGYNNLSNSDKKYVDYYAQIDSDAKKKKKKDKKSFGGYLTIKDRRR